MPEFESLTPKVMVIDFRPATVPVNWQRADDLADKYIEEMKKISGNLLAYQRVKEKDILNVPKYPVLLGSRQYDDVTWTQARTDDKKAYRDQKGQYVMADYQRLIQEYELVQAVKSGKVDEVWLFGGPYFGFYESCMVGRRAFDCNGSPVNWDCQRFVIMGFSYERLPDESHVVRRMVHDYGHRAERILAKQFGSRAYLDKLYDLKPTPPPKNTFEQFLLEHGTVHRKPGGENYGQDEFAWLTAMKPEWWSPTIDPNQVQAAGPWSEFLSRMLSLFSSRR